MLKQTLQLAAVALAAAAIAHPGLAADPPGSTPSDPGQPPAPSAPSGPAALPLPDRGPVIRAVIPTPPPDPIDDMTARDPDSGWDQQVDAIIGVHVILEGDGLGLAAAPDDGQLESSANCWDNGAGCGSSQAQFEANCHSQGGGLSSHDGGDQGTYVQCTLPSN